MTSPAEVETALPTTRDRSRLWELARLFLRLGTTAFGGPAAHVAMMEDEVVRRRGWITREKFLDLLGAVNLIPGPNSTEMAIHIGYLRAGWAGLLVAGVCFIVPAMAIVTAIALAYVQFGSLPEFAGLLYGVKPVVIAIVAQALWGLSKTAVKTRFLSTVAILATVASFLGVDELSLLLAAGMLAALRGGVVQSGVWHLRPILILSVIVCGLLAVIHFASGVTGPAEAEFGLSSLFFYFVKVGSVLYGSGYVLLAFLQGDLVGRWHWLTTTQLLDATAVGQVTPGPVFTTATFIGYLLGARSGGLPGGLLGALVATVGIFLPSFVFVALSGPLISRLRKSPIAGAFLDGVNVASLALMAVVTWYLGRAAILDFPTALLAVVSAILLIRFRVNSLWLILGGAMLGLALQAALVGAY
ncbi:MAG: chromate efflux transporter [Pirellulales bacterium]